MLLKCFIGKDKTDYGLESDFSKNKNSCYGEW